MEYANSLVMRSLMAMIQDGTDRIAVWASSFGNEPDGLEIHELQ